MKRLVVHGERTKQEVKKGWVVIMLVITPSLVSYWFMSLQDLDVSLLFPLYNFLDVSDET